MVPIGLFTPAEAAAYLTAKLAVYDRADSPEHVEALAEELGYLPLALAQAAAYLIDLGLDCATYRDRFADRRRVLPDLMPDDTGLPDDHRAALAATWSLSIEQANRLRPTGLARPMLELASLLDHSGIPQAVLTSAPALAYLAQYRTFSVNMTSSGKAIAAGELVNAADAADALRCLHRLSLVDLDPGAPHRAVVVHNLIQRATRESLPAARRGPLARAAADAVLAAWPTIERDASLTQALRASTAILADHAEADLWQPDPHPVLLRAGHSLGKAGLVRASMGYWQKQHSTALRYLGPSHPSTLTTRHHLAYWQATWGDPGGAAAAFEEVLAARLRVLGPNHPDTLTSRSALARSRGMAGDPAGAVAAFEEVLADRLRVLGRDHPDTLATSSDLAYWRGQAGDPAGAVAAFEEVLADRLRVLGRDHPDTLATSSDLAYWRGQAGDPAGAVAAFEEVLADYLRVLGRDHPDTLATNGNLAYWRGQAGDPAGAVAAFEKVLAACLRVLGRNHPHTLTTHNNLAYWQGKVHPSQETGTA